MTNIEINRNKISFGVIRISPADAVLQETKSLPVQRTDESQ